ncbi:MAG: SdpI family protein [Asticcacaulis sp.]|uniref:SdpI family protein n=1 Tax=Asticcacaulis sp. TaxID=1872648 RepID=UPI0039E386EC
MLKTEKLLGLALLLIMAGFAIWGHFNLVNTPLAVHFGANGQADGYQSRDVALMIFPGISLVAMVLMLWILPPLAPAVKRSEAVYGIVAMSLFALMTALQIMMVLSAAGLVMDRIRIIFSGVGLLFVILGNYMPKMRKNWLMGIRTPWTLSDERVWDKTHRFAGPLFMLGGAITVAGALFAPVDWRSPILIAAILTVCFVSYAYSYLVAKGIR